MAHRASRSKKRHVATVLVVAGMTAGMTATILAQPPVSRNFEGNAPVIGDVMPDVVVHDRDGAELRLRDLLKERYTVLILGCLT